MIIRVIGDVHGLWKRYRKVTRDVPYSIQVGDFGFHKEHRNHLKYRNGDRHKVLFGNHDDPFFLKGNHSLGDFGEWNNVFFIGGAYSIDQQWRTQGINWWPEEQLETARFHEALDAYEKAKPDIIITHDCTEVAYYHFGIVRLGTFNHTPLFLQEAFNRHEPKLWIFGHHHRDVSFRIRSTEFVCLDELSYIELDTELAVYQPTGWGEFAK